MLRLKNSPEQAAARFAASIRQVSRLSGYEPNLVTRQMIGSVLKQAAGRTKVAAPAQIPFRARLRAVKQAFGYTNIKKNPFGITINTGRRGAAVGTVWYALPHTKGEKLILKVLGAVNDNGNFNSKNSNIGAAMDTARRGITEYILALRKAFPLVENSAGLARQSWVQIADSLGISLENVPGRGASPEAIAKARRAAASNGQPYLNGKAQEQYTQGQRYLARLINSLPYSTKINFDGLMTSILAGEANRFAKMHEKGVFDSQKKFTRAYPWVKLVGPPPNIPN